MKRLSILALSAALLILTGCSDSDDAKQQATATPAPAAPAAPAHPAPAQQPTAATLPNHGTVKEMMHAAGYTYMNVDTGSGEPVWIAATMMRVKSGDKVQWADAAVMHNFASKSLHRTFDKILFVSNASVVQ